MDWNKLRFLESVENLKPLVKKRFGREPNSSVSREIVACLQQGRLFFEAAQRSPLEIRPLQLFYGAVGFAKALIVASSGRPLCTLKPTHGLRDISGGTSRIEDLRLQIQTEGTFQEFNDVVATLNYAPYIYFPEHYLPFPTAASKEIVGLELSLRDILSRIIELSKLYQLTFSEASNANHAGIRIGDGESFSFLINPDEPPRDVGGLQLAVAKLRAKFPFLEKMRILAADLRGFEFSEITFTNVDNSGTDEFDEKQFRFWGPDQSFEGNIDATKASLIPLGDLEITLCGGFAGSGHAIRKISGHSLSDYSFHYMGLFLLSSLVRYRPQMWMHAITRSVTAHAPADDQALSLIEKFLDLSSEIPEMVVKVLNVHEDNIWNKRA